MRFRVTEVFGGGDRTGASGAGAYGCAAELTLWADAIEAADEAGEEARDAARYRSPGAHAPGDFR